MKKKLSLVLLCFLMALGILGLSGCGDKEKTSIPDAEEETNEPEYASLGEAPEPANAEEASYGGFTAQYDADSWMFDSTLMGQFVLYDKEDYDSNNDSLDNINVRVSEDFEGPFTEKDMNTLINQLNLMGASTGFKIISNELKTFEGEPVIYYEAETKLTDEMLDMLVEDGSVTEADLEAMGGREYLISMPASKQIGINAIIDGKAITITGTYKDTPDKLLEAIKLLIKTGKVG